MVPARRLAPTTATDEGASRRATECASARCSRDHCASLAALCHRDRERELEHAGLEVTLHLEPGVGKDPQHPRVARQCRRDEASHAELARHTGQVLEQDRAEAAALLVVLDGERDLGLLAASEPVEAGDGNQVVAELGDERELARVVDLGERVDLTCGWSGDG